MHRLRLTPAIRALVAASAVALGVVAGPAPATWAVGPATGATYVALGDSYAAGEGLGPYEDGTDIFPNPKSGTNRNEDKNLCHRSVSDGYGSIGRKTPIVLPDVPAIARAFWACSGARTKDMMLAGGQGGLPIGDGYYQQGQPDQTTTVGAGTQWISISAGGNDVNFGELGRGCARWVKGGTAYTIPGAPAKSCNQLIGEARHLLSRDKHILHDRLAKLYTTLLDRAPNAVLAAVGYPRVFPSDYQNAMKLRDGTRFCVTNNLVLGKAGKVGVRAADAKRLDKDVIRGLNQVTSSLVRELRSDPRYAGRVRYADPYFRDDVVPRNCKGRTSRASVNGVVFSPGGNGLGPGGVVSTATFHPSKEGQKVIGAAVQDAFTHVPPVNDVVLGSPDYVGPNSRGWGEVAPTTLFNGGSPGGLLDHIVWDAWGAPTAYGTANAHIYRPVGNYYPPVQVPLRVSDIGSCPGHPGRAYLTLMLRLPQWPGGPLGSWFKWSGSATTCDYGQDDPAYEYPAPWPGACGEVGEFGEPGTIQSIQTYELDCDTARSVASQLREREDDFECARNGCRVDAEGLACELHAIVEEDVGDQPYQRISCTRGESTMSAWFVRHWD